MSEHGPMIDAMITQLEDRRRLRELGQVTRRQEKPMTDTTAPAPPTDWPNPPDDAVLPVTAAQARTLRDYFLTIYHANGEHPQRVAGVAELGYMTLVRLVGYPETDPPPDTDDRIESVQPAQTAVAVKRAGGGEATDGPAPDPPTDGPPAPDPPADGPLVHRATTAPTQLTGRLLDGAPTFVGPRGTPGPGYAVGLIDGRLYRNGELAGHARNVTYDRTVSAWWVEYETWPGSPLDQGQHHP